MMSILSSLPFSLGRRQASPRLGPVPTGSYFPDNDQPSLTPDETTIVRAFHNLYYHRWADSHADTLNLSWLGFRLAKCPLDLWIYQELIVRTRPEVIVECGTFR